MFERELEYFKKNKQELLKTYKGQFLVIKDEQLVGSFTTEEESYKGGLKALGNTPFLIKRAVPEEELVRFPALSVGVVNADI